MCRTKGKQHPENSNEKTPQETYIGVLADGLWHAGRQCVGCERVAPAQAELCAPGVSSNATFRGHFLSRQTNVKY